MKRYIGDLLPIEYMVLMRIFSYLYYILLKKSDKRESYFSGALTAAFAGLAAFSVFSIFFL